MVLELALDTKATTPSAPVYCHFGVSSRRHDPYTDDTVNTRRVPDPQINDLDLTPTATHRVIEPKPRQFFCAPDCSGDCCGL